MNLLGITIFSGPMKHRRVQASALLGLMSLALLTACGGSTTESGSSPSSTAASSPASVASSSWAATTPTAEASASKDSEPAAESQSAPAENVEAAQALAKASTVTAETEEVKKTEGLYAGIHRAFSAIEPYEALANANSSETNAQDNQGSTEQATEEPQPREYVSAATVTQLEGVATGVALEQYIATATEYAVSGWHTEGEPKVVGEPRMADGTYDGKPAKILEVCLDSSDVRLLDAQGNVVSSSQFPRSLNIFTLIEDGGRWKIASHDFPNNADC